MNDSDLKRRFESLHESDRRAVPGFATIVSATPAQLQFRALRPAVALLLIMLLAALSIKEWRVSREPARISLLTWSSPTAFLLETPGKQFRNNTPPLGSSEIYGLPSARKESK